MPDYPDEKPGPLALAIMSAATVDQLKANAAELSALFEAMSVSDRARLLVLAFGEDGK